jgi:toxin FitB
MTRTGPKPVAPSTRTRTAAKTPAAEKPSLRVLDSSCWLEFFADTARADLYAEVLVHPEHLVVPVVTVYEVAKKLAREAGDEVAAAALSLMQRGQVVPVDVPLALTATVNGLPLADSLIYATARLHGAELWTQDAHFEGLPGVRFFAKDQVGNPPART